MCSPIGTTTSSGRAISISTTTDSGRSADRSGRIQRRRSGVVFVAVPVMAPLGDVAKHIEQTKRIRVEASHRMRSLTRIVEMPSEIIDFALLEPIVGSGPTGVLPLRFYRKSIGSLFFHAQSSAEVRCIVPIHITHGKGFVPDDVRAQPGQQRRILSLCDLINAPIKWLGDLDQVLESSRVTPAPSCWRDIGRAVH